MPLPKYIELFPDGDHVGFNENPGPPRNNAKVLFLGSIVVHGNEGFRNPVSPSRALAQTLRSGKIKTGVGTYNPKKSKEAMLIDGKDPNLIKMVNKYHKSGRQIYIKFPESGKIPIVPSRQLKEKQLSNNKK